VNDPQTLIEKSAWVWRETLSIHRRAPETRLASSLSSVEIFVALYYGGVLRIKPTDTRWDGRDRCIISKGHGSICMYPILADLGFFDRSELYRICQQGGFLGGIPDPVIPGYETINGSLGHGLGVAAGIALGLRVTGASPSVFVVVGDGELHEGSCWDAIMFAGHHGLDGLNLIVDDNRVSMLGYTNDIISNGDIGRRLSAFGWDCFSVDGHDPVALQNVLAEMKHKRNGQPKAVIARTLKGRGVPGLENAPLCHIMNPKSELIDDILSGKA